MNSDNPERRFELEKIADTCRWIAIHPPRGFRDAVQLYWFAFVFTELENQRFSQRWMVGTGKVHGNRIMVNKLMDSRGGRFGADFDPDDVVMNRVGSLSISFLDCSTALVNYSVDNNGGHQAGTRLTNIYGHGCDTATHAPEMDLSGSWYDPSHDGEGFIVEQVSAGKAVVFWFTYDETGRQSWMFSSGAINDGGIHLSGLKQPVGGRFGRSFDPGDVVKPQWGDLTLQLGCAGGTASYITDTEGFSDGSQSLARLTKLANSSCNN